MAVLQVIPATGWHVLDVDGEEAELLPLVCFALVQRDGYEDLVPIDKFDARDFGEATDGTSTSDNVLPLIYGASSGEAMREATRLLARRWHCEHCGSNYVDREGNDLFLNHRQGCNPPKRKIVPAKTPKKVVRKKTPIPKKTGVEDMDYVFD